MQTMFRVLLCLFLFSANIALAAVNLNTATVEELQSLKGVGPAKAKAIVEYRKKNGNFKSVNDLNNVSGFGDKTVAALKNEVTVGDKAAPPATKTNETKAKDNKK